MNRRILTTLFLAAPPSFSALLYFYLSTSPSRAAKWQLTATPQHHASYPQSITNPRHFSTQYDSLTLLLPSTKTPQLRTLTDEEILARFTRGFFGGWAFWIEGTFFRLTGCQITRFAAINDGHPIGPAIWSRNSLSRTSVPALGSLIFGNFLVLDSSAATASERQLLPGTEEFSRPEEGSFVEVAYGKAAGGFSGSHRFEVWRGHEGKDDVVGVRFSGIRTNPTVDGNFVPKWVSGFHEVYAKILFANGISEILRA